ncbi:MAG TPA: DUF4326 domain-containing protein [Candidatus Angelobacter sp.]|jgi:hypothetical protein|nr:DUF4326 domain-containing protein [Candidatus Angelobacter sp.]
MKPRRIQRKRIKGWKMPPNTVYVGRPTKWGNLWTVGRSNCGCRSAGECMHDAFKCDTPAEAVDMFRKLVTEGRKLKFEAAAELRGKDLACWCPLDQPCHADVLLEIANAEDPAA